MWVDPEDGSQQVSAFGPFRLLPMQKVLLKHGVPVRLGARAMDILIALVERPGELLSRQELESRAWPQTVVEETSLRVHVSALRRALDDGQEGARYITNVPGRGYCFVAPLEGQAPRAPEAEGPITATPWSSAVPARLTSMVGRTEDVDKLVEQLSISRLLTVLGPGGIGKTTVALAVAERMRVTHTVCFVDLSLVSDVSRVPATLAAAFGLADFPDDLLGAIVRLLGSRTVVLVLDCCEHVIDAVAQLTMVLLTGAPGLRLLATSRELIGVDGEWPYRLQALALPSSSPTVPEALASPATQLFVERVRANVAAFRLSDEDALLVAELCRRLGGIPLAIEVAAARLEQFGLRGLLAQVGAGFLHLRRGRRTGVSRHEALSAMLDWSHRLLTEAEQTILRRIAVFKSPFSLRSAIWVAAGEDLGESDVVNGLAGLRAKSLLNRVVLGDVVKHQMLDHTRAYALEKLTESGDEDAVRRRHALLVCDLLGQAQQNWPLMPKREWVAVHGSLLPAIHTALTWAFSPSGDSLIGAMLASVSWPMARYLFLEDCELSIRRAIEGLDLISAPPQGLLIQLHLGMAAHLQERQGTGPQTRAAYDWASELAQGSAEPAHQIEVQIGQMLDAMGSADAPRALAVARRIKELAQASRDEVATVVADRFTAQALHMNGELLQAHRLAQAVISQPIQRAPLASLAGVVDHRVSMGILLARQLWLLGCADQALEAARQSLALAEMDSTLAVCQALAFAACPIALWRGDEGEAAGFAAQLLVHARRVGSGQWLSHAQGYGAIVESRRSGSRAPRRAGECSVSFPFVQDQMAALDSGQWHEESLVRANLGMAGWCAAEIWRRQAQRLAARGSLQEAEALLMQSRELATSQGALAWALRSATSLARLRQEQGRIAEAEQVLSAGMQAIKEGKGTADWRAAAELLGALRETEQQGLR